MAETVLLTGVTGFIAKRIAYDLIVAGHSVVGSLRSPDRADEVRSALAAHGVDAAGLSRLRFVTLDLNRDDGWAAAMAGVTAVIHTASPFPLSQPRDEDLVIRPAVDGTLRVLRAAAGAGVGRVILTSSLEAVMHGAASPTLTELDWTDLSAPTVSAYTKSKTLAERLAWDFVAAHPEIKLTTINPGMVLGTPMDRHTGSSISVVARILSGKDPAVPDIHLPVSDLADVSAAHVAALVRPDTAGQRYIVADGFVGMPEMARLLKDAYPQRRIATRLAPRALIRILALFDAEIRLVLPWLGWRASLSHAKAVRELGLTITPARQSILAAARFLA